MGFELFAQHCVWPWCFCPFSLGSVPATCLSGPATSPHCHAAAWGWCCLLVGPAVGSLRRCRIHASFTKSVSMVCSAPRALLSFTRCPRPQMCGADRGTVTEELPECRDPGRAPHPPPVQSLPRPPFRPCGSGGSCPRSVFLGRERTQLDLEGRLLAGCQGGESPRRSGAGERGLLGHRVVGGGVGCMTGPVVELGQGYTCKPQQPGRLPLGPQGLRAALPVPFAPEASAPLVPQGPSRSGH